MFDRLYRLVIHHTALQDGVLTIEGDSSKPSLGLDFIVTVNQSYVAANGKVTIRGLTTDHIGLLSAIRRYEYSKNAAEKNTVTLAVGWRNSETGEESKYTVILHGAIIEATPGPLPERSLTLTVFRSSLKTVVPSGDEEVFKSPSKAVPDAADGVPMKDWLDGAAAAVNALSGDGCDYLVEIKDDFVSFPKVENAPYPKTLEDFVSAATAKGCQVASTTVSKALAEGDSALDEKAQVQHVEVYESNIPADGDLVWDVSQETGMIGIPRSIQMGATAEVVLKDIIQPGSFVRLKTRKFPKLSSDPALYTNEGIYRVMSTTISGQFHGDEWKQTLTLNRGGSIYKFR